MERCGGPGRQARRKGREDRQSGIDQDDPRDARIYPPELTPQCAAGTFSDLAGHLDSGRTRADDEGEEVLPPLLVLDALGALERIEDPRAQLQGIAEQAQALLDAIKDDRLESLFRVMLATGLRRGEALGLHWSDVDLDAALLRVRWTLSLPSQGLWLDEPKTDRSRRTVPLPRSAIEALRARRARQLEGQHGAAGVWQDHGLVVTTELGTPLEPRNVLRRFELLAERAGLRGVTLHTLRHSAASFLLAAGTHTKVVQEHLGHSSYAITADIYSHVGPAQQREAADRLDQALRW